MKNVIDCLLTLKARFIRDSFSINTSSPKSEGPRDGCYSPLSGEEKRKVLIESKFQRTLKSPVLSGLVLSHILVVLRDMHSRSSQRKL